MTTARFNLDDPTHFSAFDPSNMLGLIEAFPEQIQAAEMLARSAPLPPEYSDARSAVIAGMGGSAIGGSLLASYGADDLTIPVTVWRQYDVPGFLDESTLFVAVSYSGGTEETLSALEAAHHRGARLLIVTTGGTAGRRATDWNVPAVRFDYPSQPRAALGYLLTPLLIIFERLGFLPDQTPSLRGAVDAAIKARASWGPSSPESTNLAKQVARELFGRAVVVYGSGYLGAVAHRWKTQINENAKTWAFYEEFPELNHNAVMGFEYPREMRGDVRLLILRGSHLPDRILRRIDITLALLDRFGVPHRTLDAPTGGRLAEMVSLIALGDYVSYYLALLNGVDPTSIDAIDFLKAALASPQ